MSNKKKDICSEMDTLTNKLYIEHFIEALRNICEEYILRQQKIILYV